MFLRRITRRTRENIHPVKWTNWLKWRPLLWQFADMTWDMMSRLMLSQWGKTETTVRPWKGTNEELCQPCVWHNERRKWRQSESGREIQFQLSDSNDPSLPRSNDPTCAGDTLFLPGAIAKLIPCPKKRKEKKNYSTTVLWVWGRLQRFYIQRGSEIFI